MNLEQLRIMTVDLLHNLDTRIMTSAMKWMITVVTYDLMILAS